VVLSVAASGTTARAASALHVTQSAVSRAVAQAEEKIGARLFTRGARGVVLTPAGRRLVEGAGALLKQLGELERAVAAPEAAPERVRLVCECYTAYRWLPSTMQNLRNRFPHLDVEIAVEHTGAPVRALSRGEIDVALLTTAELPSRGPARDELVARPLFSDEIVFIVSTAHPYATKRALGRDDLRAAKIISSNTPPREAAWFARRVFGKKVPELDFLRFPLTEAVIDAARAGMGVAVLSEWMASGYLGGGDLVVKRLASGPLRRPWRIAYRRDLTEAAEGLAAAIADSVAVLGGS
jgi:LysR family transcriptional regulator for metE and metH